MKAVIYARYSSDNQREESIEGQLRECTAFAEKNGITILRHYIDRAYSAKTDNRPEFQNMIKDSSKKLFDMVIVWKLDRFARNRYDSARYKAQLKKNGIKVVSATEVISEGAEGIILESVLEGYAEYYSADLSEKVIRGMTDNALKCKYNGGTLPIGYIIDEEQHFQIDSLTAPFVLDVFKKYDKGATMTELRDWLNECGIKNTRGQSMKYNSVQHMLTNRRYIGEFKYRDVIVPDGIPAIVPQDLFDRVQRKLEQNKKTPARNKAEVEYLLTTKLFCGHCGAYMCGESGKSRNGTVHHYYKCVSVKKKRTNCKKKAVRKQWLEDLVVTEVMKVVMDDKAIEAIVSQTMDLQDRENTTLPVLETELREVENGIQNILNAIQMGILTKSTKSRLEELESSKEDLEIKIANEKITKPRISGEFITFWLHKFRKLDINRQDHRKWLINVFVNAIYLYDDKMIITFNYKDSTKTITLDDVKKATAKSNTGSDLDCHGAPAKKHPLGCFFFLWTILFSPCSVILSERPFRNTERRENMDADFLLIHRMKNGDDTAIETFVRKFYPVILRYCHLHIQDHGYAEDITQETFARFFRTLNQYQHYGKAQNYLYVIAANICRDYYRKPDEIPVDEVPEQLVYEMEPLDLRLDVHLALDKLPPELKEVTILFFFQDVKQKEIAKILEIGLPLVKYRIKRAKELLAGYLGKEEMP